MASFVTAMLATIAAKLVFNWDGNAGLVPSFVLFLIIGVAAGIVVSLLTKPENQGRIDAIYLCIRTPIGQEHILREAGFVELPGTGTFDLPHDFESRGDLATYYGRIDHAQVRKETIAGFVVLTFLTLGLLYLVILLARWLGGS